MTLEELVESTRLRLLDAYASQHLPMQPDRFAAMALALVMQCPPDIRRAAMQPVRPPRTHDIAWLRKKRGERHERSVMALMSPKTSGILARIEAARDLGMIDSSTARSMARDLKRRLRRVN